MNLEPAVAGDIDDVRTLRMDGIDNLDDVTAIEAHVWKSRGAATTLAAEILDATARTVSVSLGDDEGWLATATPDAYLLEIEVEIGDATLTWPNGSPAVLWVRSQGD